MRQTNSHSLLREILGHWGSDVVVVVMAVGVAHPAEIVHAGRCATVANMPTLLPPTLDFLL